MHETLLVIGLFVLAVALRTARTGHLRKLGALTFLGASFALLYFLTGHWSGGVLGVGLWFMLPWVELLTRIRPMRLPLDNRLSHQRVPNPSFFPNATKAAAGMEEAGFEHATDCGWEWAGMQQYFRLYWHPEERAVAAVCLCEHDEVAFAFVSITSQGADGNLWRTTNFPFSPILRCSPDVKWNHIPCGRSCFHQILCDHRKYLHRMKIPVEQLRMPDPDQIEGAIELEMRRQVDENLAAGLIQLTGNGNFQYSRRGLLFLWGQFVKDMVRLC